MNKFTFGLTRKQCGVVFANIKNGKLNLEDDFANWMYNHVADYYHYSDSANEEVMTRMRNGLDSIFSGNYEKANDEFEAAYKAWHLNFK